MLVRSQRQPLHVPGTGENVGPGSYSLVDPAKPSTRFSQAPFGSTSVKLGLDVGSAAAATPGVGTYSPVVCQKVLGTPLSVAVHPSAAFSSRTGRFVSPGAAASAGGGTAGNSAVGPGSYDARLPAKHNTAPIMQPPTAAARPAGHGGANNNNKHGIEWVKVATAPSIPTGAQAFGYEEGPGGALVQQPAPYQGHAGTVHDHPAPGEYNPSLRLTRPAQHVPTFDRSRSQRHNPAHSNTAPNLGPGAYFQSASSAAAAASQAAGGGINLASGKSCFNSRTERIVVPYVDTPGPGEYNLQNARTAFQDLKHYLATHPEEFSVFGASKAGSGGGGGAAGRGGKRDGSPGPGAYDSAKPSVVVRERNRSNAVFNSNVSRFEGSGGFAAALGGGGAGGVVPGPGAYNAHEVGSLQDRLLKAVPNRFGAFGSTSRRFPKIPQANESSDPSAEGNDGGSAARALSAPNAATAGTAAASSSYSRDTRTSAFRPPDSVIARQQAKQREAAMQGPTWTEMRQLPDMWQKKAFSSTPSMYTSGPRLLPTGNTVPGPGSYDTARDELSKKGVSFNVDRRPPLNAGAADTPACQLSHKSMLRQSFNVTFS